MISVKSISKQYKSFSSKRKIFSNILEDVFFEINKNDVIGLVGHNGSGKTTLLKILFNLIKEDTGEILLNEGAGDYKKFIKEKASLINKNERSFFWRLSVKENINFFNSLLENPGSKTEIQEKISFLEIDKLMNKKFGSLSSGEKTKVLILRGLLKNPKLIFFDEIKLLFRVIVPLLIFSKPAIVLSIVVFPIPEGPKRQIISPSFSIEKETFFTLGFPPA